MTLVSYFWDLLDRVDRDAHIWVYEFTCGNRPDYSPHKNVSYKVVEIKDKTLLNGTSLEGRAFTLAGRDVRERGHFCEFNASIGSDISCANTFGIKYYRFVNLGPPNSFFFHGVEMVTENEMYSSVKKLGRYGFNDRTCISVLGTQAYIYGKFLQLENLHLDFQKSPKWQASRVIDLKVDADNWRMEIRDPSNPKNFRSFVLPPMPNSAYISNVKNSHKLFKLDKRTRYPRKLDEQFAKTCLEMKEHFIPIESNQDYPRPLQQVGLLPLVTTPNSGAAILFEVSERDATSRISTKEETLWNLLAQKIKIKRICDLQFHWDSILSEISQQLDGI